jgi:DNA-binding NarL/FixJ family response regulator
LALPDRLDGGWRILFFEREVAAKPFGARERAILETVRPFLCRPISAGDAVRRRQRAAGLTARELEVLAAVREGLTNDGIAARLLVSEGTVRKHLEHVSAKLGARTRAEAVAMAWR